MALQTSIAQYFNSRKRPAVDEIKRVSKSNKVLILDKNITDVSECNVIDPLDGESTTNKKVIFSDSPKIVKPKLIVNSAPKLQRKTPKTASGSKNRLVKTKKQCDIRKSLLASFDASLDEISSQPIKDIGKVPEISDDYPSEKVNVPFEIKGCLSPRKKILEATSSPKRSIPVSSSSSSATKTPVKASGDQLNDLKTKLLKSSRLDEIRKALKKVNEGHEKLKEIESKIPPKSPSLKKFKSVEIEFSSPTKACFSLEQIPNKVPQSPSLLERARLMSPGKADLSSSRFISPRKLFTETSPVKAPAFERQSALAAKGKPSLVLPFKYRALAETSRAVDAVISILFNRNETIFFSKLKASVQQMSKKNLTETHLAQIHSICQDMFSFRQEKLRHVPGQADKYELVVTPIFDSNNSIKENEKSEQSCLMTPSVLLERKRKLYNALLEKTKDFHQDFLSTLDPPIVLDRKKLTRWHPEFDVDGVPDIQPAQLPQPPNVEKFSSAKDVLCKARDMFMCNPRMERALEKVSSQAATNANTPASASIPALASALKGIPKSLLEKVRAKQAAKAAANLTCNPQTMKRRLEYSRLPDIARIVRNTFVGEKKNILPKILLLTKLGDSYREILSPTDLEHHLNLLMECSSGWLSLLDCRKELFYKISKETDLSLVLNDIQKAISQL